MELTNRIIAVVGGDEREQEIARLAAAAGAEVRAHGFPWPDGGIPGVAQVETAAEALAGAHYALFPIPGMAADGSLFAPAAPEPIRPDAHLLRQLKPGSAIILGWPDDGLRSAAAECGITLCEYEQDTELMLLRGPAIVEGALGIAIANTDVTLHGTEIAVVGHGNIGRLLARTLTLLGARVHLFARNPTQRADSYTAGCIPHPLTELEQRAANLPILFSTVPSHVVSRAVLERMPQGSLVMDLAAPPGGIDLDAARELGHTAIWARGLGRRAPVTVGRSQWGGIAKRIAELEERRNNDG